ncbi:MAG TPA: hypothetical protein VHZ07_05660 [Bryobacteraceae bacterium]|jgi:hypothetical protein|nr:hypothetical protein [Bryobacteraceae bacterium]
MTRVVGPAASAKTAVPGFVLLGVACLAAPAVVKNEGFVPFADAPIHYRSQALSDPVARLERRLERGETSLRFDRQYGYLPSVLAALHVPVSSQTLVFSKTSFQFPDIGPAAPRALYFNDDVYVGRVQRGKFLEFVSFDPIQGAIFYVMDEANAERPRFERAEVDCVQCHVAASTRGVPGVMMRSVFTRPTGYPATGKSFITGQESPFSERWGGWYVTAKRGAELNMGNTTLSDATTGHVSSGPPQNLTSLAKYLDTKFYPAGTSDIVALLVLAHQTQMHNLITETNYRTRLALYAEEAKNKQAGLPPGTISDAAREQIEAPAEQLVRYLLFTNEVRLAVPVEGTSSFAKDFAARGPRDARGRSLRDFDLQTRIFKYPCSYLIYSEDFDAIPALAKDYIYSRLYEILTGRDNSPEFASLSSEDRNAIFEILVATKPGLPDEWKRVRTEGSSAGNIDRAQARAVNRQP